MAGIAFAEAVASALAVALVALGCVAALTAPNLMKRLVGVLIALTGAVLALAALGAPASVLTGAVTVAFAYTAIGVSLLVRGQEEYGLGEAADINAADDSDEPVEPTS